MSQVDLPRGLERVRVHERDHEYMLRGSESRTLTTVGAFRVVPAGDLRDGQDRPLDPRRGDLYHLRQSGLVQTIPALGRDRALVVLTERGRDSAGGQSTPFGELRAPRTCRGTRHPRCPPGVLRRLPKAQGADPRRAGLPSLSSGCGSTVRAWRERAARRRRLRAQARVPAVPAGAQPGPVGQRRTLRSDARGDSLVGARTRPSGAGWPRPVSRCAHRVRGRGRAAPDRGHRGHNRPLPRWPLGCQSRRRVQLPPRLRRPHRQGRRRQLRRGGGRQNGARGGRGFDPRVAEELLG